MSITLTTIKPDSYDEATETVTFPLLYKLDSLGKLRTWRMQKRRDQYRTLAGLANGKQAVSGWTTAIGKQGRSDFVQAEAEVISQYRHQLDREYHDSPDTVGTPKMIEPMLAKTYSSWPGKCMVQPKLDGIRCIADVNGLWTRQGQPIIAVPHLHAMLAQLFAKFPDAVLDGELYNHDLREDFGAISSIVRKKNPTAEQLELAERVMQYHVYDMVSAAGDFPRRKGELLASLLETDIPTGDWLHLVPSRWAKTEEELRELYGRWTEQGYEGAMVRLPGYDYELGRRSKSLLKMKEFITEEFKVISIDEGNGNWAGAAKRMSLLNNQGTPQDVFGAGIRGSYGAGVELLKNWNNHPEWWDTATATVRFFMRSPDGVPRFPVVVDFQPQGRKD